MTTEATWDTAQMTTWETTYEGHPMSLPITAIQPLQDEPIGWTMERLRDEQRTGQGHFSIHRTPNEV